MKLFLVESVTAGAFDQPLEHGLLEEADLMLGMMVAEALRAADASGLHLQPRLLRRAELAQHWLGITDVVAQGAWSEVWRKTLAAADAVWLVAPESGGELATLSAQVRAAGARLLGSSPDAVALATSKQASHAALAGRVRQPDDQPAGGGWVVKPDDGVATTGVRRLPAGPRPAPPPGGLVQPFVPGMPLSLCVLSDGSSARVVAVNRQHIRWDGDGNAHYCGGITNAIPDRSAFVSLANAVQAAIPGLWGFWGIDCVMPADGHPVFIEINPRLTTAFVHLRAATGFDALAALLALADGVALADLAEVPTGHAAPFYLAGALETAL